MGMERVLPVLIILAMLATLAVLGLGLLSMARGDSARRSNKLMQSRVLLQGLALLLFLVFMWLFRR
jgi:Hypoxia induced protein conserved region